MNRILCALLFLAVLTGHNATAKPSWFDESHDIFLTQDLARQASHYRDFPLFWWNFIIVDVEGDLTASDGAGWDQLGKICAQLGEEEAAQIRKLPCRFDLKSLQGLTRDWLRDLPRRDPAPGLGTLQDRMGETLTKASMPMDRALIDLLRLDPLNSLQDLKTRLEKRMQMNLTLRGGYMADLPRKRVLLPLQFAFSPADSAASGAFQQRLKARCKAGDGCRSIGYFGPHFSTHENEAQITKDVDTVSWIGMLALAVLVGFILITRRHHLLSLVPILAVSIVATVAATVAVFGKIHGLTIAFGPGLVGLAMDYGIHAAFLNPRSKAMWRSNHIGLLTSVAIMVILGVSRIPLLRQLMFFSTFGLCFSYAAFFVAMRWRPAWFEAQPYQFTPRPLGAVNFVSIVFLFSSLLFFANPIQLDVQHLNFESKATVEAREWFVEFVGIKSPYLVIEDEKAPLEGSSGESQWAAAQGMAYEGISAYLPTLAVQDANLKTWRQSLCTGDRPVFTQAQLKFFAPFWKFVDCDGLIPLDPSGPQGVPDYLADFHHGGRFVGLFFPQTDAEVAALRAHEPRATTPREIFSTFPRIFLHELLWMVPLAVILALSFLYYYYRHAGRAALAMVPFFTGVGCYALVSLLFGLPVSFISLVGLLMIFGFSLDYGVFVMDFLIFKDEKRSGVWSALSFCCFATLAGFAPLVFARHPVLKDLGHALLWGSLGTYIGSLWGVPWVFKKVWRV